MLQDNEGCIDLGELRILDEWVIRFRDAMRRGHKEPEIDVCFDICGFSEQQKEYIVKKLIEKPTARSKELRIPV